MAMFLLKSFITRDRLIWTHCKFEHTANIHSAWLEIQKMAMQLICFHNNSVRGSRSNSEQCRALRSKVQFQKAPSVLAVGCHEHGCFYIWIILVITWWAVIRFQFQKAQASVLGDASRAPAQEAGRGRNSSTCVWKFQVGPFSKYKKKHSSEVVAEDVLFTPYGMLCDFFF